ncbi:hypothetical protein chiPu_0000559 [Chiloscyllium punctatum]|uniref:Uncharacterized protein n=1 Tax=Chiloscyllium punctatum TaxID=137246 RepID=A0A401RVI5_CHIPU|nr:hypothetical protein [Chiloscyllium punctatum]
MSGPEFGGDDERSGLNPDRPSGIPCPFCLGLGCSTRPRSLGLSPRPGPHRPVHKLPSSTGCAPPGTGKRQKGRGVGRRPPAAPTCQPPPETPSPAPSPGALTCSRRVRSARGQAGPGQAAHTVTTIVRVGETSGSRKPAQCPAANAVPRQVGTADRNHSLPAQPLSPWRKVPGSTSLPLQEE